MNLIDTAPMSTAPMSTAPISTAPIDTALAILSAAGIGFDVMGSGPEEGSADFDVAA